MTWLCACEAANLVNLKNFSMSTLKSYNVFVVLSKSGQLTLNSSGFRIHIRGYKEQNILQSLMLNAFHAVNRHTQAAAFSQSFAKTRRDFGGDFISTYLEEAECGFAENSEPRTIVLTIDCNDESGERQWLIKGYAADTLLSLLWRRYLFVDEEVLDISTDDPSGGAMLGEDDRIMVVHGFSARQKFLIHDLITARRDQLADFARQLELYRDESVARSKRYIENYGHLYLSGGDEDDLSDEESPIKRSRKEAARV